MAERGNDDADALVERLAAELRQLAGTREAARYAALHAAAMEDPAQAVAAAKAERRFLLRIGRDIWPGDARSLLLGLIDELELALWGAENGVAWRKVTTSYGDVASG